MKHLLYKQTADFLQNEFERLLKKLVNTKSKKTKEKINKQLEALKGRIALEVKLLDKIIGESD